MLSINKLMAIDGIAEKIAEAMCEIGIAMPISPNTRPEAPVDLGTHYDERSEAMDAHLAQREG
jgi:hypothetical protein